MNNGPSTFPEDNDILEAKTQAEKPPLSVHERVHWRQDGPYMLVVLIGLFLAAQLPFILTRFITTYHAGVVTLPVQIESSSLAQLAATPTVEATPSGTLEPDQAPVPTVIPTDIPAHSTATGIASLAIPFVNDTFNSDTGQWIADDTASWTAGYDHGRYRLVLHGQPSISFSSAIDAEAYRVSADVAVEKGAAGITFLSVEPATFYRFLIRSTGTYAVQRHDQANNTETNIVEWTSTPSLRQGRGVPNRLQIERNGATVRLFGNDQHLTDIAVPTGKVVSHYGVVLTAPDGQGEATFDNLFGVR